MGDHLQPGERRDDRSTKWKNAAMERPPDRWNLNLHHHRAILEVAPIGHAEALDIGCGEGLLTFDLAARGMNVVGIDLDEPSIGRAKRNERANCQTEFVCGDVFAYPFEPASFDLVASSAMLHHVDARRGLRRMRELVRPGGTVAVVGFARPSGATDRALALAGSVLKTTHRVRGTYWEHESPVRWPPPLTMAEMRDLAAAELPGASFTPGLSNRYVLTWTAPLTPAR